MVIKNYTKTTSKRWHLVAYSEEVCKALSERCDRWAYIAHEPDDDANQPHFHMYAYKRNAVKGEYFVKEALALNLERDYNVRVAPQSEASDWVEYVMHTRYPEKKQYTRESITFDNDDKHWLSFEQWNAFQAERKQKKREANDRDREAENEAFISDLIRYGHNPVYLAKKYGRDYIKMKKQYDAFLNDLRSTAPEVLAEALCFDDLEALTSTMTHFDFDDASAELGDILVRLDDNRQARWDILHKKTSERIDPLALSELIDEYQLLLSCEENTRKALNLTAPYHYAPDFIKRCKVKSDLSHKSFTGV